MSYFQHTLNRVKEIRTGEFTRMGGGAVDEGKQ